MTLPTAVEVTREFWRLMASNDFHSVATVLAAEFVLEWPQSKERIRGAERFARMNCEYVAHGPWVVTVKRIVGNDTEAVSEVEDTDGVQFGKAISQHQAVRHKLVSARTKLQAARHMLYHAAWLAGAGRPCSAETSMAKLFVADVGVEIALACQQVMGAYALSDAFDMERHVRDLLGMPIVGGSSDMQKNNLASLWKL